MHIYIVSVIIPVVSEYLILLLKCCGYSC